VAEIIWSGSATGRWAIDVERRSWVIAADASCLRDLGANARDAKGPQTWWPATMATHPIHNTGVRLRRINGLTAQAQGKESRKPDSPREVILRRDATSISEKKTHAGAGGRHEKKQEERVPYLHAGDSLRR